MAKFIKLETKLRTHEKCGAVIEYTESECIIKTEIVDYDWQSDYGIFHGSYKKTFHYLKCPNCGGEMKWE